MHDLAGVLPVITLARVGAQIGFPEYALRNHTAPSALLISSRCGVMAGEPVLLQSPHPMSSAIMITMFGFFAADATATAPTKKESVLIVFGKSVAVGVLEEEGVKG